MGPAHSALYSAGKFSMLEAIFSKFPPTLMLQVYGLLLVNSSGVAKAHATRVKEDFV